MPKARFSHMYSISCFIIKHLVEILKSLDPQSCRALLLHRKLSPVILLRVQGTMLRENPVLTSILFVCIKRFEAKDSLQFPAKYGSAIVKAEVNDILAIVVVVAALVIMPTIADVGVRIIESG